jgi:hypothetical protein
MLMNSQLNGNIKIRAQEFFDRHQTGGMVKNLPLSIQSWVPAVK